MAEKWVLLRYEGGQLNGYRAGEVTAVSASRWSAYIDKTDAGEGTPEGWVLIAEGTQEQMQALHKLSGS